MKDRSYMEPVKNIAETPTFLRNGRLKDQIAGRGSKIKYKSLTTFTAPIMIIRGVYERIQRNLEHLCMIIENDRFWVRKG